MLGLLCVLLFFAGLCPIVLGELLGGYYVYLSFALKYISGDEAFKKDGLLTGWTEPVKIVIVVERAVSNGSEEPPPLLPIPAL